MEADTDLIAFEEWIRKVFAHEVIDYKWWWNEQEDTAWNELPPQTSVEYLTRLFEESGQLLRSYTNAQVDQGLWLLLGPFSDHVRALENLHVEWPTRLRCVRSILRIFEMFEARCSQSLGHIDEAGCNPLNSICYMFWHLFRELGRPSEPAYADLNHALLAVMTEILGMPSDACRESALHGLGHWQSDYPQKVEQIVDSFIAANRTIRPELLRYAERARVGNVQ